MSREKSGINHKKIDDMLIASIRFRGQYEEIPKYFDKLYEQVKPYVSGKGIFLHHYFDESLGEGHDFEVCYPVRQAVETEEVKSRVLEGGEMLYAIHIGPHGPRGAAGSLSDTWRKLWAYMGKHEIIPDSGPRREVYLEDTQEHKEHTEQYVTEVQLPYAFYRMARLAENLERFVSESVRQQVMAGSEEFDSCSVQEKARWFKEAMERLDALVDNEQTRSEIMISCGDQFPKARIRMLRAAYKHLNNIDEILQIMRNDRSLGDRSWYENPTREGNVIHVSKDPFDPERYREATDEAEKRSYYCHCRLLRDAIRAGVTMSRTYCYCGAGWYKQLWEGILEKPVRIEVLQSVLQGDNCCSFAIHLPLEKEL